MSDAIAAADPADQLRVAQARHRRRMLLVLAAAALAAGAFVLALVVFTGGGSLLPRISKPYFYEVNAPGAPKPSYLFGTMHVAYSVDDLPRAVLAAQDRTTTTVLESDLEARAAAPPPAPGSATTTGGGRRRLDDAEWAKLSEMTGMPEAELEAQSTSRLLGAALATMLPPVEAMDRGLQRRARQQGKELAYLEARNLEQVIADDGGLENGKVLDGLRNAIQHRGAFRAELVKIASRYARGDDRACAGSLGELVVGLNDDWEAAIQAHIRRGDAFIAIGCGHLIGEGSIVERLEARGFTVTRVP
ncbi:MAG TPA: TraB/GumN family protein [Kofleriaceae bacterium]|nr:TraB/GumN family protein [Kofleriaceae bacterium]